jgi:hypothetical protein
MATYSIDSYTFAKWDAPPRVPQSQLVQFTLPGKSNAGFQHVGVQGQEFVCHVTAFYANQATALTAADNMKALVDSGPVEIVYNDVNYYANYDTKYKVLQVDVAECKAIVGVVAAGVSIAPAVRLVLAVRLRPHYTG